MSDVTIRWSDTMGKAVVKFTPKFNAHLPITKLDMIQDAIQSLQERYNQELTKEHKRWDKIHKEAAC